MVPPDPTLPVASADRPVLLEVCVDCVAGARAAQQGGADRIELCTSLIEGGTTPSSGMIQAVLEACDLPVMVMIRPRGGDYCYDREEIRTMQAELDAVLRHPVAGVVFGALTPEGQIDIPVCRNLCRQASSVSTTFHRAFDQTRDARQALHELLELPIDRLLSSGQQATALEGVRLLRQMVEWSTGRIRIMPGAGVGPENVQQILRATSACEVHLSASEFIRCSSLFRRTDVPLGANAMPDDDLRRVTSAARVRAVREAIYGRR